MDLEKLLPVFGIIVGWLLNELSKYLYSSRDDKRINNRVISKLLLMRYQTYQFIAFSKGAINAMGAGPIAEKERQRYIQKHSLAVDKLGESYSELFKDIAGIDPILAMRFGGMSDSINKVNDIKLSEMSNIPIFYQQTIDMILAAVELSKVKMEEMILRLALKTSIFCWFRVRKEFKKGLNALDNWSDYYKKSMNDIEDYLKSDDSINND